MIKKKRSLELILSTIGGIMILGYGMIFFAGMFVGLPQTDETLNELRNTLGEEGFEMFQIRNTVAGISGGGAILLVSRLLSKSPGESRRWGIMILILSAMSVVGMGFLNLGVLPGVVLGTAGGALAIVRGRRIPRREVSGNETGIDSGGPVTAPDGLQGPVVYRCSVCSIDFGSDEELARHVARFHMNR